MSSKLPLIIAHRGSSAYLPENTIPAFKLAFEEHHADMIEFDIRWTKEGIPVVFHDENLERTTNAQGKVSDYSLEELRKFDSGYRFDPVGNQQYPCRGKGFQIPLFEELLDHFNQKPLAIEIKENSVELTHLLMKLIAKHKNHKNTVIGSEYACVSKTLRKFYPDQKRFYSKCEITMTLLEKYWPLGPPKKDPFGVASVPIHYRGIRFDTLSWIRHLHRKNSKAFFWTIDNAEMIRKLAGLGADGIVTNDPAKTRNILTKKTETVPKDA
ncbi:MAG: hypothetical protein JW893_07730 [Candidatus Omnitrophica bacterium]|nr:hypothetical protein [Candidatus Omnitrophota bacterium]